MYDETKLPLNLQFFAEDGDDGNDNGDDSGNQNNPPAEESKETGEQTFTQAQLTAIAANEKKQGKQSILSIFGVKNEKDAKKQAEEFKAWKESQQNAADRLKEQEDLVNEVTLRAIQAENKLTCLTFGVNKDCVDDVMAIATSKVTEDVDLNKVLEEMKKEPKYKGFFEATSSVPAGTGTPAGHSGSGGTGGSSDNLGKRLGEARNKEKPKSNFFVN